VALLVAGQRGSQVAAGRLLFWLLLWEGSWHTHSLTPEYAVRLSCGLGR
jgi:hypothetical protein